MAHTFEDLVKLEQAAEDARARLAHPDVDYDEQWEAWREAAGIFQTAVTKHAEAEGKPRVDVEMAVKKAVRHAEG
ncbi:hypothetical protein CLM62_12965 [Streptomyces sp. SA15]|uniref:hypothetical protein n=1 Tax=Streptomyces sp. SA15 TaxID=934019 RepID=UPI000BAFD57C|nr:hypothetical protein [Streptomyces sp. SA15]PAZ15701.1 hypothetical protein CLM62_12965 [Streptomyces sp. SA15]